MRTFDMADALAGIGRIIGLEAMILNDALNSPIRWAAVIHNVREVILAGVADLGYWREALGREGLFPFNANGRAEILISAPRLVWMGLRFCELSVGIAVTKRDGAAQPDGTFLAHAFNSSRLLAWSERTFFRAPYFAADVQVDTDAPVNLVLSQGENRLLRARMAAHPTVIRTNNEEWEGPVYLPRARAHTHENDPRNYFLAHLSGDTQACTFTAGADVFELNPARPNDIMAQLRDSGFAPREWRVRRNALHAKSRTLSE